MKFIKRLKHDAREMTDAIFGWDIFRCRDYSDLDGRVESGIDGRVYVPTNSKSAIYGYTIILALNIKGRRFFKRLFIKTT